jgi:hypothetical protein
MAQRLYGSALTGVVSAAVLGLATRGVRPVWCQTANAEDALTPCITCNFHDGLRVVRIDPLAPGITVRDVDTDGGARHIEIEAGMRISECGR